jgi:hypothetical protein
MIATGAATATQSELDSLIGQLYEAPLHGIHPLLTGLSPRDCGELAVYCYSRAHLREIGLAIAASCDRDSLVAPGSTAAGNALFELSRESPQATEQPIAEARRAKITLAAVSA